MSKYGVVIDGKVTPYRFKKMQRGMWAFYLGDAYVGQLHNLGHDWSCVGKTPNKLCPIRGFKSRLAAVEMLLKLEGFYY